ncbi:hypothetical protein R1flu_007811 [Riccia fluitans]|uniref:Uncharacterized protein n=1 Tax=Riccia fluitans TaxID=41844 RepID=A0ABD1YZX7_9MARC
MIGRVCSTRICMRPQACAAKLRNSSQRNLGRRPPVGSAGGVVGTSNLRPGAGARSAGRLSFSLSGRDTLGSGLALDVLRQFELSENLCAQCACCLSARTVIHFVLALAMVPPRGFALDPNRSRIPQVSRIALVVLPSFGSLVAIIHRFVMRFVIALRRFDVIDYCVGSSSLNSSFACAYVDSSWFVYLPTVLPHRFNVERYRLSTQVGSHSAWSFHILLYLRGIFQAVDVRSDVISGPFPSHPVGHVTAALPVSAR